MSTQHPTPAETRAAAEAREGRGEHVRETRTDLRDVDRGADVPLRPRDASESQEAYEVRRAAWAAGHRDTDATGEQRHRRMSQSEVAAQGSDTDFDSHLANIGNGIAMRLEGLIGKPTEDVIVGLRAEVLYARSLGMDGVHTFPPGVRRTNENDAQFKARVARRDNESDETYKARMARDQETLAQTRARVERMPRETDAEYNARISR